MNIILSHLGKRDLMFFGGKKEYLKQLPSDSMGDLHNVKTKT